MGDLRSVERLRADFNLPSSGADLWQEEFESFGIDESRLLKERQSRRAVEGKKFFVLIIRSITVEAQNALLKVLEEPTEDTHIFLILPQADLLLPTIHSRCLLLDQYLITADDQPDIGTKFLESDTAARMKLIEKLLKGDRAKAEATELLNSLQVVWQRQLGKVPPADYARVMERLGQLRSYLGDRSAATRLILEETAFLIPKL